MLLDIDKDGSLYHSQQKFIADSTAQADIERQMKLNSGSFTINRTEKPGQVSYKDPKSILILRLTFLQKFLLIIIKWKKI